MSHASLAGEQAALSPHRFICFCLGGEGEDLGGVVSACEEVEWADVISLLRWHRVAPLLWSRLEAASAAIPEQVISQLRDMARESRMSALKHSAEMSRLSQALQERRLPHMFIKGPALSMRLYGDHSQRQCRDLDLLADPECKLALSRLLKSLGYVRQTPSEKVSDRVSTVYLQLHKDWVFYHPERRLTLELHFRLDNNPHLLPELSAKSAMSRGKHAGLERTLSAEEEFIYLSAHGTRSCWARLSWVTDIDAYVRSGRIDWSTVVKLAGQWGVLHLVQTALLVSGALLKTPDPLKDLRRTWRYRVASRLARFCISCNKNGRFCSPLRKYLLLSVFSFNWKYQYYHWTHTIGMSSNDVVMLPLPGALFSLYFFLRPVFWVWRYLVIKRAQFISDQADGI
ncbi:hypothetical protein EUZ85_28700 [Hahella sp. KA22]|uniref:nucleotidyltransferase domain-containing protein n=1 Tax=Hahella sp. KA22 TaxID=1628392 RepID=UPI000FDEF866|nr:nucleotidyltransferase family protein [Hahella sp. KA22]AZZ94477.1 hypothetical protein ENC22_26115 [Hahella sp. KA22]QAY57850.1 hypothetical protein EUZ85_28700 [Hahella sp. KA22]